MNDHHRLGRALELFDSDPLIGAGLPYRLPAGAATLHAIEQYVWEVERRAGYSMSIRRCWASGSCMRSPGIGPFTARTCSRR
jgi:hypothetical protein